MVEKKSAQELCAKFRVSIERLLEAINQEAVSQRGEKPLGKEKPTMGDGDNETV
jgi:hypothetical protein